MSKRTIIPLLLLALAVLPAAGKSLVDCPLPEGFKTNVAETFKGHLYIVGSVDGESAFLRFNPVTGQFKELPPAPGPALLEGSSLVHQHNGREDALYLIGGVDKDGRGATNVLEYLPTHNEWHVKAAMSDGLEPLSLKRGECVKKGAAHILVSNGETDSSRLDKVLAYHTITDTWITLEKEEEAHFGWVNYSIVGLYLLLMLVVGFYFSRRNSSSEMFFKGGSNIPWWAAGVSIFATTLSAITFLSIPAKAYATDWGMFIYNMTIIMVVPLVVHFFLPLFRKLKVASVYQYLEERFNGGLRSLASAFFCLFMFSRIAIVLFLPSLALNAVTGINIYVCILLMGIVTLIYSTSGGIEAVVWGDVIQGFLLLGGALVSLIWLFGGIDGGVGGFFRTAAQENKFQILNFSLDWTKPVFWVAILGGFSNQFLSYTSDQSVVQKYLTVKDNKETERGLWLNGILSIPTALLFFGIGTGLFVFFKQNPELLSVGMSNNDSIFPHYIMKELPTGVSGLLIAAVFAAAMSTLSSNINSSTTVMSEDFYAKIKKGASGEQKVRFARISGIIVGTLGILTALALATFDIVSLWDWFNFFLGLLTSGLGGLFMMGIFTKRIGPRAALAGFVGSFAVLIAINATTPASPILYGLFGLVSCFAIGYIASFVFGKGR